MTQTVDNFGKRELNKAQTRQKILQAVYQLSQTTSFAALKVKDIVEHAGVTEMTFFNYFVKKEDILKYMMGLWAFDLMVLEVRAPLQGEAAIRRLFRHSAQQVEAHPRLMANFVASLLSSEIEPQAMQIEPVDRYWLHSDLPELLSQDIPSGNQLILQHLAEIPTISDPMPILLQLASCFYGDLVVAHTGQLDLEALYMASLDRIFAQ